MHQRATVATAALMMIVLSGQPAAASDPDTAGIARAFEGMKRGLDQRKEELFARHWDKRGYASNLVGASGIAGKSVFRQGARKRWYLKPDIASLRSLPGRTGAPWIVTCDIWSSTKDRAVDRIWALVIYDKSKRKRGWLMLGGGERVAEVEALGARYVAKRPLGPPVKGKR